jgi:hypothetical protein
MLICESNYTFLIPFKRTRRLVPPFSVYSWRGEPASPVKE